MESQYKPIFTPRGQACYNHCIGYLITEYNNPQAATRLYNDIMHAINIISVAAHAYPLCEDKALAERGIRKLHLKKYPYKIFYHIDGETAFIDAILHDKQDVAKVFS